MRAHSLGYLALRVRSRPFGAFRLPHRSFANTSDANALDMMDCNGVMGSYAKALYLAAKASKNIDSVMSDLSNLHAAMTACDEFNTFVVSPCLRSSTKVAFLRDDLKTMGIPELQKETLICLEILFEQRRSGDLPKLAQLFETLYMATKGEVKCFAHSAVELSPKHKTALEAALKKRLGDSLKPALSYNVNPNLIGGLVVRIGDQVIDASVSSKLDRMYSQLSHGT
ncbi:ATP synthase delta subunit [Babesia ovis]|uniref:ATP synthase delta subunit n=1 Tax=Babesia ovis TaxID=5869 RepID=A0A9W5T9K3_BABOV|nr:ATP synthase delta subunit [Babesia ovis]